MARLGTARSDILNLFDRPVLNPPMEADGASPIRTTGVCARGAGHYFRRFSAFYDNWWM
ncbi:MAG: hypothetical protein GX599_06100 [Chloroflexi bacterium]|nr:hypothetical protein [Chloroflexota bacterium]